MWVIIGCILFFIFCCILGYFLPNYKHGDTSICMNCNKEITYYQDRGYWRHKIEDCNDSIGWYCHAWDNFTVAKPTKIK
jgi:hypothetical protein